MRQLTFIKKGCVEWLEVPEPQLTDSLQAIVRPFVAARCDGDCVPLFRSLTNLMNAGIALHVLDPIVTDVLGRKPFQGPFAFGHECIAGGLSLDHTRWIRSHPRFFLPIPVLREVFRGKFVDALKLAFPRGQLHLSGDLARLAQPKSFAAWLRPLFRKKLGSLLQAPLRRPPVCAPVSRPLHPSRRHLQPSTGLVGRRPSHRSLAGLGGP